MAQVPVKRKSGVQVSIELAGLPTRIVDGRTYYQAPGGWWFYETEGDWTTTREVQPAGSYSPSVLTISTREKSYRESEIPQKELPAPPAPPAPPATPTPLPPPVIASQADVARLLGRSPNTTKLLQKLKEVGTIARYVNLSPRKNHVWFADPQLHQRALDEITRPGS